MTMRAAGDVVALVFAAGEGAARVAYPAPIFDDTALNSTRLADELLDVGANMSSSVFAVCNGETASFDELIELRSFEDGVAVIRSLRTFRVTAGPCGRGELPASPCTTQATMDDHDHDHDPQARPRRAAILPGSSR